MRVGLLIIVVVLLAWGASLAGPFHFDDYSLLVDPLVTSARGWWLVWQPIQTRPLSQFTFWISYMLSGATAWPYHLWNLALHVASSVLVWRTLRRCGGASFSLRGALAPQGQILAERSGAEAPRKLKLAPPESLLPLSGQAERAAMIAALVFAVHPMQAEVANYVFARSSALSTFLCLIVLWLWLRDRIWLATAVFALALLAKEECVTFPLVLALLDWWRGKRRWKAVAAMLSLAFALGMRVLIATQYVAPGGGGFASRVTPVEYFTSQGVVILRYLRLLVAPWGFTVDPEIHVVVPLAAWLVVALIVAIAWRLRRGPGVWILSGLILLIPSSSIFPADDLAADRRMYLPMIAFAAAIGVMAVKGKPQLLAVVGLLLLGLSIQRTLVWNSERTLWEEAVHYAPDKVRPRIQLARALGPGGGLEVLDAATVRFPGEFDIETERGRMLLSAGRAAEALGAFGKALAIQPSSAMAMNNRGVALAALGQYEVAQADFGRALNADPCFVEALQNLRRLGFAAPDGLQQCLHPTAGPQDRR